MGFIGVKWSLWSAWFCAGYHGSSDYWSFVKLLIYNKLFPLLLALKSYLSEYEYIQNCSYIKLSVIPVRFITIITTSKDGNMDIKKILTGLILSMLLSSGVAVAADFNKGLQAAQAGDFKTALAEWTPLAEQGNADVQTRLGVMYANGTGVLENDKTAVKWYALAAKQGYARAQFGLGIMYSSGHGVQKNRKTAVKWYTLAAEQGEADAQSNLGLLYEYGKGVLKDNWRAYMWYSLGSYNGSKQAGKNKSHIAKDMTSADISKAQEMSSRCLESNYTDC